MRPPNPLPSGDRRQSTECQPRRMRPATDSPARQAYEWGRHDWETGELPQPENFPGREDAYWAGWNGHKPPRTARRTLRQQWQWWMMR